MEFIGMGSDVTPTVPPVNASQLLADLQDALLDARLTMEADTDHDAYCVVPNTVVKRIEALFNELDMHISSGGQLPANWR